MKRKKVLFMFIAMVLFLTACRAMPSLITEYKPDRTIKTINYNNYIGRDNTYVDYFDNRFAYLNQDTLTITDTEGNKKKITGVFSPFQLNDENVLYIYKGNLFLKNVETSIAKMIAENVEHFISNDDKVYYTTNQQNQLYRYDLKTNEILLLHETQKIMQFSLFEDEIFIANQDDTLVKMNLDGSQKQELLDIDAYAYPYKFLHIKGKILLRHYNSIRVIDLKTKEKETITIDENPHVNNQFYFICNEKYIYVSYGVRKTNGSIVTDVESEKNGIWKIDFATGEKEKISPIIYSALFLYEDDLLLGYQNGKIQQVK